VMVLNLTVAAFMGLVPIYARSVFKGGTELAGTFSAVQGVGAIIGTVGVTILAAQIGRSRVIVVIVPVLFVSYVGYAAAPSAFWACVALVGLGAGASGLFVTGMSIGQRDAPDAQRGRVLSLIQASMGTCYGLGILWIGVLGDAIGLRQAFAVGAAALAVSSLVLARAVPGWRGVLDGQVSEPSRTVHLDDVAPSPAVS
jgi:MFS family permease